MNAKIFLQVTKDGRIVRYVDMAIHSIEKALTDDRTVANPTESANAGSGSTSSISRFAPYR